MEAFEMKMKIKMYVASWFLYHQKKGKGFPEISRKKQTFLFSFFDTSSPTALEVNTVLYFFIVSFKMLKFISFYGLHHLYQFILELYVEPTLIYIYIYIYILWEKQRNRSHRIINLFQSCYAFSRFSKTRKK